MDGSRFLEFKKLFGANLVCGFSYLAGSMVGVVANCGPLTGADAQKGAELSPFCLIKVNLTHYLSFKAPSQ